MTAISLPRIAAQRRARQPDQLLALELRAARGPTVAGQQAEQRHRRLGLARAGLTHDGEHLTGVDVVADVDGRREPLAVDEEGDVQVLDLEDRSVVVGHDRLLAVLGGRRKDCSRGAFRCGGGLHGRCARVTPWAADRADPVARPHGSSGAAMVACRGAWRVGLRCGDGIDALLLYAAPAGAVRPARLGRLLAALRRGLDGGVTPGATRCATVEVPWPAIDGGRRSLRAAPGHGVRTAHGVGRARRRPVAASGTRRARRSRPGRHGPPRGAAGSRSPRQSAGWSAKPRHDLERAAARGRRSAAGSQRWCCRCWPDARIGLTSLITRSPSAVPDVGRRCGFHAARRPWPSSGRRGSASAAGRTRRAGRHR